MFLDESVFQTVIASTPLVSIDLIVRDVQGRVLLGKRNNRPAQGLWFVPGGRIRKGETVPQAFVRLVQDELGIETDLSAARFNGLYDHFYPDSIYDAETPTHYVVSAFEVTLTEMLVSLPNVQHHDYRWFSEAELLNYADVHEHTRWYFVEGKSYSGAV